MIFNKFRTKTSAYQKHAVRFRWWHVLIIAVIVAAVAISGVFLYLNQRIHRPTPYVNNWQQAQSDADSTSSGSGSTSQTDEEGLASLDAGDFDQIQTKDYPIIKVKQKDPNIENILLIGIDGGTVGGVGVNRADSMIVMSINYKTNTLKLASLLRDTKTYFPNTGTYHKLNAAFSYGGPGLQIDVINYAYKLDIQKYIQLDFAGFQNIIDAIGGVPIQLTAQEASYSYINVGKTAGVYNLDGAHALGYTRTRKIDTDFQRTQRQRNVMFAIYNKFKNVDIIKKMSVLNQCASYFQTNIPTTELASKLTTFESNMNSTIQQVEIPAEGDGMYTTETSPIWFWNLDWDKEVAKLQNFLYGG